MAMVGLSQLYFCYLPNTIVFLPSSFSISVTFDILIVSSTILLVNEQDIDLGEIPNIVSQTVLLRLKEK